MFNYNSLKFFSFIFCASTLSGCGGSDGSSSSIEGADITAPIITLVGESTIKMLAGELYTEPGFTALDAVDGDVAVTKIGGVDTQIAGIYILTYMASDISGNSASKTRSIIVLPSVTLNIQSKNYYTGSLIEGALISVSATKDGNSVVSSGVTDENGEFSVVVSDNAQRITASGDADGYGEYSVVVSTADQVVDIFLQPINADVSFTPSAESNLDVLGLSIVTLPANSLVDENGNGPIGDLNAELTVIDPSLDPDLMPGNFEARDSDTGEVEQIESFGAINVTFDDADGNRYNLASGQSATIRIPLASRATIPPATIPLYHFNEETGYWEEEGSAALTTGINGEQYYEGTVSHFSTWNADIVYDTIQITGCIEDNENNPVNLATMRTQGVSYSGQSSSYSDTNGNFSVSAKSNSSILLSSYTADGLSRTTSITTGNEDTVLEECIILEGSAAAVITLTWGEHPRDLDTQFFGPNSEDGNDAFLLYYSNKDVALNNSFLWLDVDDTSSYGPEITTISSFPYAGRYTYAIKHFSGSSDIAASPARVKLDYAGERQIFSVPEGEATKCWAVFDFVVDETGEVNIETLGTWENDNYCGAREYNPVIGTRSAHTKTLQTSSGILKEMVESKYYAQ